MKDHVKNCIVLADFADLTNVDYKRVTNAVRLKFPKCIVLPNWDDLYDFANDNDLQGLTFTFFVCFIVKSKIGIVDVVYQSKRHFKRTIASFNLAQNLG